jgi:hypothetical protein
VGLASGRQLRLAVARFRSGLQLSPDDLGEECLYRHVATKHGALMLQAGDR